MYDHGARNRNPISTLWYGIDPLWEKYPDYSPYNYCAGNPVKLVDPDGRDLFLTDQNAPTSYRNRGYLYNYIKEIYGSKRFKIHMNQRTGQITTEWKPGRFFWQKRLSSKQMILQKYCNETPSMKINLCATSVKGLTPNIINGRPARMYGGAFGGNEIIDGVRVTYQHLYIDQLKHLDEVSNSEYGRAFHHELTETIEGGKLANDRGIEKVYPTIDENSWEHKFYLDAHDKAESQPPIERQIQPDGTIKFVT